MARLPHRILNELKKARAAATLEEAKFGWPDSTMTAQCRDGDFSGNPDEFIKERVRLYHSTWIIGPLDRAIAWAEKEMGAQ